MDSKGRTEPNWWARLAKIVPALAAACGLAAGAATAQPRAAAPAAVLADLVAANRILADLGVVDGFGHVSVRDEQNPGHFFMARSMAPALVTEADIMTFDLEGSALGGDARTAYLERFIHSAIYKARPDVKSIVHSHSPSVIPFAATGVVLKPIYHMSSFLGSGVPVWDIHTAAGDTDMLVRSQKLGESLAATLAGNPVSLMRGHGSVTVGPNLHQAVFRAYYTEMNARLQGEALRLGPVTFLNAEEARLSSVTNAGVMERAYELWKRKVSGEK